ncbi:hypothetical protein PHMEG_00023238 [Phytophthora megakarya]|uniref:Uncharacterized protein n=1 Tax=Phytophthora megakarya TaxID=4795 RepID=A0A225VJU6_9STRA|nr:hypothetical protein PHMEG_00023238 [Phytophthora megakarya]
MFTHATPGTTSATSSPSSRAPAAPTDSESQAAARADVVDVTEEGEPWTVTSARRVSDPPPLRSSNRAAVKSVVEVPPTDGRKGKRKTAKRVPPVASKKSPRVDTAASESESEEKAPLLRLKRQKTLVPAPEMSSMHDDPRSTVTSSRAKGFNLNSFLVSFLPGVGVPAITTRSSQPETVSARVEEAASTPGALSLLEELRALKTEVHQLRGLVGASEGVVAVRASVTVTNTKGELPPAEVCYLTSGSFPEGSKKAKVDYNPPKAHMLTANRMFRTFGSATGKSLSAMAFVLRLRELDCVKFQATPAVLMVIFSGRLGSRG